MKVKTYLLSGLLIFIGVALLLFVNTRNNLTGAFSFVDVAPEGFEFTPPKEVSPELAGKAIQDAELEIAQMRQRNFTTTFVTDVLNEANIQYKQENYTETLKMTELIDFISRKKTEFIDKVELTKRKEQEYRNKEIDTNEGQVLVGQAVNAFYQDQLVDAQKLLQQADTKLEKVKAEKERQKSLAYLSRNFFLKYWWQIVLVVVALSIISPLITKKVIKRKRQQALAALKEELVKTQELIKRLQKTCFIDKKITTSSYKQKAAKYEERIAEIKHTLPVIEAQLKGKKELPTTQKPKGIIEVKR